MGIFVTWDVQWTYTHSSVSYQYNAFMNWYHGCNQAPRWSGSNKSCYNPCCHCDSGYRVYFYFWFPWYNNISKRFSIFWGIQTVVTIEEMIYMTCYKLLWHLLWRRPQMNWPVSFMILPWSKSHLCRYIMPLKKENDLADADMIIDNRLKLTYAKQYACAMRNY